MDPKMDVSPFDISGKVALVTGGAGGIGAGIVRRLTSLGASVVVADLEENRGRATAADVFVGVDVSDPESVDRAVAEAISACGRVDFLVNNAAITESQPLSEVTVADIDRVFGVNLNGVLLMTKAFAASVIAAGHPGKVVNIASGVGGWGPRTIPREMPQPVYGASKGAVIALTTHLAKELGPQGIHVNGVAPGFTIHEDLLKRSAGGATDLFEAAKADASAASPLGRVGEPDDIAKVVAFLLSPASDWLFGLTILSDGGWWLGR